MSVKMRDDGSEPATRADMRGLCTRLDGHDQLFESVISRLDGHDRRLEKIDGNLLRLDIAFAKMSGDMVEVKVGLKEVRSDISRFSTILERSSGNIEAALRKMDMQASMLMDHEGRITKLEPRPS